MLLLLEATGARRTEVAYLTVDDVLAASKMKKPMLRIRTVKRSADEEDYRLLPISRTDIERLATFIRINRAAVIRKICGSSNDDGRLLISGALNGRVIQYAPLRESLQHQQPTLTQSN